MKTLLLALLLLSPGLAHASDSEIQAGSITMSPSNPATNSDVTICFSARNTAGQTIRFAVGYAASGYVFNSNTVNQINWLLDDRGVYRGGSLTISGSAQAVTSNNYTDVLGPNSGINAGTTTGSNWEQICFQTHIPPELSGAYQLVIVPGRDGISLQDSTCGTTTQASNAASFGYLPFTVSGNAFIKLNLEVCNDGSTSSEIDWKYKVTNWGESGIRLSGISMSYCFFDTVTCMEAQGSSNAQTYDQTGAMYCNTYNPSDQYSFNQFNTVDCGTDGKANQCYNYTIAGGPISQSMPYFIPPNGGNIQSGSPHIWFRKCGSPAWDTTDDYANLKLAPTCGSGWSSLPKVALYNNGSLVCEWSSSGSTDSNSGIPYCGSVSGCNACPAGQVPNMSRNATGASNVACVAIYSPTPTPQMQLTKTADKTTAVVGDRITFCLSWSNDAAVAKTMIIWDTVPTYTTYVGCANGCAQSGGVVSWNLGSQAAGASGQVCFWSTVTSLPSLPRPPGGTQWAGTDGIDAQPWSKEWLQAYWDRRKLFGR